MINDINKKDNIFMHDAVPTWSGFLYQGRIAAYLAVKKINDLYKSGNECEIKNYKLEMEKCEDIAIICDDGNGRKYQSILQFSTRILCPNHRPHFRISKNLRQQNKCFTNGGQLHIY